jgi:hypothetical protein
VLKVFAEFSNSALRRENLKECFDFCEVEFRDVIRHVPTRWLSLYKAVDRLILSWTPLKAYFLAQGSDECTAAIWKVLKDQENEMADEGHPTFSELYLYFTHFFMSLFQETMLKLENKSTTACDLYMIMEKLRDALNKKKEDKFFGMKVTLALRKHYIPQHLVGQFTTEALKVYDRAIAYIQKWFSFEQSPYLPFKCLALASVEQAPSLDDVIDVWMVTPLKSESPPDALHDEVAALSQVFTTLQGSTGDKWRSFFTRESAPNLLRVVQYVLSIPVSNASVERVFSVMGNIWSDERNRLDPTSVRSELSIF